MERLIFDGRLKFKASSEVITSRLGIGFEKLDRGVFDPAKAYDKVSKIGIKKIRLQSGWQRTEREKGVYDFTWLDDIVKNLVDRGMEPWLCLCYGNPLYTPLAKEVFGAVGCPPVNSDEEYAAWERYVSAVAERYKGVISIYEIWNEPDCGYSWKREDGTYPDLQTVAAEYGEFCVRTSRVLKAHDPEAKAVANVAHLADLRFVHNMLSAPGFSDEIDYVSYHCYSSFIKKRHEQVEALRRLINMHNPNIGIIQGESGTQSRSDGAGAMKRFAWSPEKQTKLLLRILLQDLHTDVLFTSYFSTMDMIEALHGRVDDKASYLDFGYFGVISATFDEDGRATGNYTEKPSYFALSALCSLFEGDVKACDIPMSREVLQSRRVNGYDCDADTIKAYGYLLPDGRRVLAYWNEVDILTTTYEGTVTFCLFDADKDRLSLVDLKDGSIYRLPDEMVEETGNGGLRLRNLPISDSPVALVLG